MLRIALSNRFETLRDAVAAAVGVPSGSPFEARQIVVPSSAARRALTTAIADGQGVCANVEFVYLAEWLWRQIARVVVSIERQSPFAAPVLTWRIYELLSDPSWYQSLPRLANYLSHQDPVRRLDLATETACLFEQYITYRADWMSAWLQHERVPLKHDSPGETAAALAADQAWQAELWRRLSAQIGAAGEHPAAQFFRQLQASQSTASPPELPASVHVFCLPAIPPLYMEVLAGLGRWIDVHLYVLNPCQQYWFEIVDPRRLRQLVVSGKAQHQETGNRLLASWGQQTKAQIELLLEKSVDAPVSDRYHEDFPENLLGQVQRAIFDLVDITPGSLTRDSADRSIEVHVCHSLTRELEVLQDQLLTMFGGPSPPQLSEVLVVMPDLEAAAPLIEAVFGNVPSDRALPYSVSGRARSTINASAKALLSLLAIIPSRFAASALLELLQQPIVGRRFHIGREELVTLEGWMRDSGIRWGIDSEHRQEQALPALQRFTIEDGLHRLFLGYALPTRVSVPVFERVPAGEPEGSKALDLGLFANFFHHLTALRAAFLPAHSPADWHNLLNGALDEFLLPADDEIDDLAEVRQTIGQLHANMLRGQLLTPLPLSVVRAGLEALLDDPARGGVPTGAITFSSMSSLRNLPFKVIAVVGLNDGAFPAISRPTEFDLMAADPRRGDRQRRADDRNLFLDLLLAARERFYVSYVGRSIRDNSVLPSSVVVSELIEALIPAIATAPEDAACLSKARAGLVIEHPLQAFSPAYFLAGGDLRLRSFNRELCAALRESALTSPALGSATLRDEDEDDNEEADDAGVQAFFPVPLAAPGAEWRVVSLEQFISFFRNPCRFLLRDRLGMSVYQDDDVQSDDEPFVGDFDAWQRLAERLMPQAMQGFSEPALEALARAGIEYPPGTLGTAQLRREMASIRKFALRVAAASRAPSAPVRTIDLAFDVDGESWRLTTVLSDLRGDDLIRYRYDDTRPSDYLSGWLTHLLLCASMPTAVARTQWISRDGSYSLEPCAEAASLLRTLMALYKRGLRQPVHFFVKSAWAYLKSGRDLVKAREKWKSSRESVRGEGEDHAYQLALRGMGDPIDAEFQECVEAVFGQLSVYIQDDRLKGFGR